MTCQFSCYSFCILAYTVAAACGPQSLETHRTPSEVIAVVNGQSILEEEFESFTRFGREGLLGKSGDSPQDTLFQEFLMEHLLFKEAEKSGIVLSEKETENYLRSWILGEKKVTPELVEHVRRFLMIQKFLSREVQSHVKVNLRDMRTYYREHEEEFVVEDRVHVLEILVDNLARAEEIRSDLEPRNFRSFRKAAQDYSNGRTSTAGGDLGTFERGQLPENFEKFIFKLRPGEISAVFKSGEGFHIFMLEEWIPRHPMKFHEAQGDIFEKLVVPQERLALKNYVNQLRKTASIELRVGKINLKSEKLNVGIE